MTPLCRQEPTAPSLEAPRGGSKEGATGGLRWKDAFLRCGAGC